MSKEQCLKDFYTYLQIDLPNNFFRQKIKGYCLAFNIRDKYERISKDDIGSRYKVKNKKHDFNDVKKVVQEIREKRERDLYIKNMDANKKYLRQMKYIE